MKKRILSILLTAALACTVLAGCKKNVGTPEDNAVVETEEGAEEEEESGYLFGYSGIDMDNPYFETLELSIKTTLEEKGHRIMTKNPGADAALQNEQIRELIEADVDAVFLSPVDQEEITPALEELKEAGIPVVNVDTRVKAVDRSGCASGDPGGGSDQYPCLRRGRFAGGKSRDRKSRKSVCRNRSTVSDQYRKDRC